MIPFQSVETKLTFWLRSKTNLLMVPCKQSGSHISETKGRDGERKALGFQHRVSVTPELILEIRVCQGNKEEESSLLRK